MLAEAANHMGPNTKKFCPRCYADKSTCIEQGQERESDKTRKILNKLQLHYSKDLSQRHGIKFYENCLWEIIDPHSDIPVGQLHWMYLGLGKFILKKSFEISDNLKEKLVCIIDAMDQSSFKSKISSEIVTYIDSRQGKDIKNYLQIAPFHFAILGLPVERVKIVSKLAELSKIFSMGTSFGEDYLEIVEVKIHRLLKDIKNVYPVLLGKVKTHLSTHIGTGIIECSGVVYRGKSAEVLGGVIDVEEDINENQLRKAERNKSFKPIRTAFNDDDELQAIQSSLPDLPNLHNCHRILYKSVVTRETRRWQMQIPCVIH
ncbi:unnamed protein product [Mytilus edulis]|uniref:Uncharacterized protein n=1 Tax=Mytilus edulis TaxID=6550 RepID=A0A8S3V340_MYTED|nr:unnamed protein product [Mytilus edulis]